MKKHGKSLLKAFSAAALALPLGLIVLTASRTPIEVKAIMSTDPYSYTLETFSPSTAVKTNIDLTDLGDDDIRSYYAGLDDLPESERQGGNLLKNLKRIICTNPLHPDKTARYASYDNSFKIYSITDREWDLYDVEGWGRVEKNSIANATLNEAKNMILTYSYPNNDSASAEHATLNEDSYTHFYYRNDNLTYKNGLDDRAYGYPVSGKVSYTNALLNREHLWSKSHGFDEDPGAGSDVHHLVAADTSVNSYFHSNYPYAEVGVLHDSYRATADRWGNYRLKEAKAGGSTITLDDLIEISPNAIDENLYGTSATSYPDDGGGTTVFEPRDADKGEIARALLFMCARYNWIESWNPSTGVTTTTWNWDSVNHAYTTLTNNPTVNEPDLMLVNKIINKSDAADDEDGYHVSEYGCLNDILRWNREFPVTEYEIHRNNLIYNNYQYTRNPFIDFPEWADYIWGRPVDNPTYTPRNSDGYFNPLGAASPATDRINEFAPDGVTLSESSANLDLNGITSISINAVSTDHSAITWGTSNDAVATVSKASSESGENVTITAVGVGNATITASATIDETLYQATFAVTVTDSSGGGGGGNTETISLTINEFATLNAYGTEDAWSVTSNAVSYSGYADLRNVGTAIHFNPSSGSSLPIGLHNQTKMPGRITSIAITMFGTTMNSGKLYVYDSPIYERTAANTYTSNQGSAMEFSFAGTGTSAGEKVTINTSSAGDVHYFSIGTSELKATQIDIVCDVGADAAGYANRFLTLTNSVCASYNTNTASSFSSAWTQAKSAYTDLSASARALAKNPESMEAGSDKTKVADAYARYVYILNKYDKTGVTLENYLNASLAGLGHAVASPNGTSSWILVVTLLSSALIGGAGAFQIFRKKRIQ